MRRCERCGIEKPWLEFQRQANQVNHRICVSCRNKEEQIKINKGLDISELMKRWAK